jgi:branched-chain amino acid aminotransferase
MAPGVSSCQRSIEYGDALAHPAELDASKLCITKTLHPSKLPPAEDLKFGKHTTGELQIPLGTDETAPC